MAFIETTRQAIEARLITAWTLPGGLGLLRTPIAFESGRTALLINASGTTTTDRPPSTTAWIRCTVRHGASEQKDLNSAPRIRHTGRIFLDVFVPQAGGRDAADVLTDLLLSVFDRAQFSGITCRASSVMERGQDAGWWASQVSVPFFRERLGT